jgi:hypothetical protein
VHRPAQAGASVKCVSDNCHDTTAVLLTVGHRTGVTCTSRRCRPCAARLASRYLDRGYAIHIQPIPTPAA